MRVVKQLFFKQLCVWCFRVKIINNELVFKAILERLQHILYRLTFVFIPA